MTCTDVLRMAREAGIPDGNIPHLCHGRLETGVELLERFAALVAAEANAARIAAQIENEALKERMNRADAERCAAVLAEREACAALVASWNTAITDQLAANIRARGAA